MNPTDEHYAKVTVEKATKFQFGHNIYPMTALVRGYCVIVDNNKFDNCIDRAGSRTDAHRLHQVFSQLNFSILHEENKTAKQMLDLFEFISKRNELISHNALVIIILSHGHHGIIYGVDYKEENERTSGVISVRQLIDKFSDKNCLDLKGKPKMFFLSCCRGDEYDTIEKDAGVPMDNDLSDMFVGYATRLGYVAFRNQRGSYFGVALAEILIKHAFNIEFDDLFKKIESNCRERTYKYYDKEFKAREAEQIPNFEKYKWTKKLYFNPGLTNSLLNSAEITDVTEKFIIKNVIILDHKYKELGFKCYHLTEFGPPIIYSVKPYSSASKFNLRIGDIIVKANNEWAFYSEKWFKKILKLKKKRLDLIIIRLKHLNAKNIRDIEASICDKLSQNSLNQTQNTSEEIIEREAEPTQEMGKTWEIALTYIRDKSEIICWHYLAIDVNAFENNYKINETEPYIAKNYGIQLVNYRDIEMEPPLHIRNHFENFINHNTSQTRDNPKSLIYRMFRKS